MIGRLERSRRLRAFFGAKPLVPRACAICGGLAIRPLLTGDRDFIGLHTGQCEECGFVMTSPHYGADVLTEFYGSVYRAVFKGEPDPRAFQERQRNLRDRAIHFRSLLVERGLFGSRTARVLDLGCGEGTLLRELKATRPEATCVGVEPDARYGRALEADAGIRVLGDIGDLAADESFDLIVSIHVLEHVAEPTALLAECRRRLGPDGRLVVDVPDVAAYDTLDDLHLAHCNHFSAHTLALALRAAGLAPESLERHRPPTLPASLLAVARPVPAPVPIAEPDPEGAEIALRIRRISPSRLQHLVRRGVAKLHRALGRGGD